MVQHFLVPALDKRGLQVHMPEGFVRRNVLLQRKLRNARFQPHAIFHAWSNHHE